MKSPMKSEMVELSFRKQKSNLMITYFFNFFKSRKYFHSFAIFCLFTSANLQAIDVPELSKRVTDQAGILSEETIKNLETKLKAQEESTSNQIAVFTLSSLDGETIEDAAIQVFDKWKLGQKSKNNGILLIVAPTERKMRIEVGRGLEGALTDVQAYRIIQTEIKPKFKAGDMNGGVEAGVNAIIGTISGEYKPSEDDVPTTTTSSTEAESPITYLLAAGAILVFGLFASSFLGSLGAYLLACVLWYAGLGAFFSSIVSIIIIVVIGIIYIIIKLMFGNNFKSGGGSGYDGGFFSSDSWSSGSDSSDSWSGGGGDSGGGGSSGDW
ncbi:TPM domain-containing protein [Leptospira sp. 'Mane']|uniref:TPM domain-containing protein n=1 Tax=Leptospira sp. 'Mane' TaxID=3387407 RepID=UPI00398BA628